MVVVGVVVVVWCALRLAEETLSVIDTGALLDQGAVESCRRQHVPLLMVNAAVPALVVLHVWQAARGGGPMTMTAAAWCWLVILVLAEGVHWWAIATLGRRWTTGVLVLPGETPVARGPYRWVRHPGYAGGLASALALSMLAGSVTVAALVLLGLGAVVVLRVRCESSAWESVGAAGLGEPVDR